jgi:hypothetical protein
MWAAGRFQPFSSLISGEFVFTAYSRRNTYSGANRCTSEPEWNRRDRVSNLPNDFDQIAVVVDWLDACRTRNLNALLDLYAPDASLECECDGLKFLQGRAGLESYWRSRLDHFSPDAFGVNEILLVGNGVVLDCSGFDGKPVRVFFSFDGEGKIRQSRCAPSADA